MTRDLYNFNLFARLMVSLYREGTGSNYTREQRALFDELDPLPVCFVQLVSKQYPLKAVCTLEKKKKCASSF